MKIRIAKDLNHQEARTLLQHLPDSALMIKQQKVDRSYSDQYSVALSPQDIDYLPDSASVFGIGPDQHCEVIEGVYLTVTVSMQLLFDDDCALLDTLAHDSHITPGDAGMVMKQDTGFIIKLHADTENPSLDIHDDYSEALKDIVGWAVQEGFNAIEFNADCPIGN